MIKSVLRQYDSRCVTSTLYDENGWKFVMHIVVSKRSSFPQSSNHPNTITLEIFISKQPNTANLAFSAGSKTFYPYKQKKWQIRARMFTVFQLGAQCAFAHRGKKSQSWLKRPNWQCLAAFLFLREVTFDLHKKVPIRAYADTRKLIRTDWQPPIHFFALAPK